MQKAGFQPPWIWKPYRKWKPFAANGRKKRQASEIQGGQIPASEHRTCRFELFAKRTPMEIMRNCVNNFSENIFF